MVSEANVRTLLRDKRLRPPVVSLYLSTDRATPEGEKYLAGFRQLLHQADWQLAVRKDAKAALARNRLTAALPELLQFLDEEVAPHPAIRGVALFLSLAIPPDTEPHTPAFTTFTLPRPVRSQVLVERRASVRPLLFLLDQYERVGVLVADRAHARIFTLFLGELECIVRRTAETPHRHHQGWKQQMFFQRDANEHVKAHLRGTAREAVRLFRRFPLKRLVLGGTDETLGVLQRALPRALRGYVIGTFHSDTHAADRDLVTRALGFAQAAEHAEEEQQVRELVGALARSAARTWGGVGTRAVHGIEPTLRALSEKRVRRLLLRRSFRVSGAICDNCKMLHVQTSGPCTACRMPLRPVTDVVEYAVEHAQEEGAEIEFVAESPTLEALGGIGALLRF